LPHIWRRILFALSLFVRTREGIFLYYYVKTGSGTHAASDPTGAVVFRGGGGMQLAREVGPSSAEVKNAWDFTTMSPTRTHGVVLRHREMLCSFKLLER
jgi:hypothetical protein